MEILVPEHLPAVHLVCDLETFATSKDATVFEIALAAAHNEGYHWMLPTKVQNRAIDMETITWWRKQENRNNFEDAWRDQQRTMYGLNDHAILRNFLEEANHVIRNMKALAHQLDVPFFFWGNSPSFDQVILADLLKQEGFVPAWDYRDEADVRTLRKIFGGKIESAIPHNALADAKAEIEFLRSLRRRVPGLNLQAQQE